MSKKFISYSKLLHKMGQAFLDLLYQCRYRTIGKEVLCLCIEHDILIWVADPGQHFEKARIRIGLNIKNRNLSKVNLNSFDIHWTKIKKNFYCLNIFTFSTFSIIKFRFTPQPCCSMKIRYLAINTT